MQEKMSTCIKVQNNLYSRYLQILASKMYNERKCTTKVRSQTLWMYIFTFLEKKIYITAVIVNC